MTWVKLSDRGSIWGRFPMDSCGNLTAQSRHSMLDPAALSEHHQPRSTSAAKARDLLTTARALGDTVSCARLTGQFRLLMFQMRRAQPELRSMIEGGFLAVT